MKRTCQEMALEDFRDKALQLHTTRQDRVRLERFIKEKKSASDWQTNWSFLMDTYEDSASKRKKNKYALKTQN